MKHKCGILRPWSMYATPKVDLFGSPEGLTREAWGLRRVLSNDTENQRDLEENVPCGRLNEKYVQRVAIEYLVAHYRSVLDTQAVVAEPEAVVSAKTKLGSGRADGLVIAQLSDETIYTVTVEAKSARTLSRIRHWYRDEDRDWVLHALLVGGFGLIVAAVVGWSVGTWFWMWVFPALIFLVASFACLLLTVDQYRS